MATWDTADLVARCVRTRRRPTTDAGTGTTDWYAMLTEAEAYWKPIIALHWPHDMLGAPVKMTTSDNKLYTLPSSEVDPLFMIVLRSPTGDLLRPGPYWSQSADYCHEAGGSIRITNGREMTFADGPYARIIAGPGAIDGSHSSSIKPERLKILLVYHACELDASRGGLDDPSFYAALAQKAAFGDPNMPGDVGMIGSLKAGRSPVIGMSGSEGEYEWWKPA